MCCNIYLKLTLDTYKTKRDARSVIDSNLYLDMITQLICLTIIVLNTSYFLINSRQKIYTGKNIRSLVSCKKIATSKMNKQKKYPVRIFQDKLKSKGNSDITRY